jgi:hypothetical protein
MLDTSMLDTSSPARSEQPADPKRKSATPLANRTRRCIVDTKISPNHRALLDAAMQTTRLTLCASVEMAIEAYHEKLTREREIINRQR